MSNLARDMIPPKSFPVSFCDFSANGQSDARARVILARVEPLEHLKDAFEVLRLDADPIVLNRKNPFISVGPCVNADFGPALIAVFDGVPDQILEQLRKLRRICKYCR